MSKANDARWAYVKKHHSEVAKVMKEILAKETYENVLTDNALTDAIRERGVYCTATITHKVRVSLGIVAGDQRRIDLFAKEFKKNRN
ncbi:hypothetical protein C4585_01595 [Candidatus Parcubacteria bacterium]|nr:MAG: hypothetical protein C4585_01595 [Candidatus Parcubacteria bacterium]